MVIVETLQVEISAKNNIKPGIDEVRDDLKGFSKRLQADAAVSLSLRIGELQQKRDEALALLKQLKKEGDREGQIQLRANIELIKRDLTDAGRQLTNFARTGQKDVSVLGKLFGGIFSRMDAAGGKTALGGIGAAVSAVSGKVVDLGKNVTNGIGGMALKFFALEKVIGFAKKSLQLYLEESGKIAANGKEVEKIEQGFKSLEYTVGSGLFNVIQRFFAMFGEGAADGMKNVAMFVNVSIALLNGIGAAIRGTATGLFNAFLSAIEGATNLFKMLPQAAEASFGYILEKLDGFVQDWAQGVKDLSFGKIDLTGSVGVGNPFKGINFPDFGRQAKFTFKQMGRDWDGAMSTMNAEFGAISTEMRIRAKESAQVQTKAQKESSKAGSDAHKKALEQQKQDEKEFNETRKKAQDEWAERTKKNVEKVRGQHVTLYETINGLLEKSSSNAKTLADDIASKAKESMETQKTAATSLGERYVEVLKEIEEITAGREDDKDGMLGKLMKEKNFIESNTDEAIRQNAKAYDQMNASERIVKERDDKLAAIDAETVALNDALQKEIANVTQLTNWKIAEEQRFTAAYGALVQQQISESAQLTSALEKELSVRNALRAASGVSAQSSAATAKSEPVKAGDKTVTINATVRDNKDLQAIIANVNAKVK